MDEVAKMTDTITATVRSADEYRKQAADCREQSGALPTRITKKIGSRLLGNGKTWPRWRKRTSKRERRRDGRKATTP